MTRVTKAPEERRQEIIDTAVKVFYEDIDLGYCKGDECGAGALLPLFFIKRRII